MDLSKLPRLSETDKHTPPPQAADPTTSQVPSQPTIEYRTPAIAPESFGAQVWLNVFLGIVFMMLGRTFASFLLAKLTGQTFHTYVNWTEGSKAGQEVAYFELEGYTAYTDAAIFLFGVSCVLEGAVTAFVRRNTPKSRALLATALLLNVGMTLFNMVVAGMLFQAGTTPLLSLMVIAFGGYSAITQWQTLRSMLASARVYSTSA